MDMAWRDRIIFSSFNHLSILENERAGPGDPLRGRWLGSKGVEVRGGFYCEDLDLSSIIRITQRYGRRREGV